MLCANAAHDKLSEKLSGLTPSSRSTPAASSPCRGPLTKKRAPFSGIRPGGLWEAERIGGIARGRVGLRAQLLAGTHDEGARAASRRT